MSSGTSASPTSIGNLPCSEHNSRSKERSSRRNRPDRRGTACGRRRCRTGCLGDRLDASSVQGEAARAVATPNWLASGCVTSWDSSSPIFLITPAPMPEPPHDGIRRRAVGREACHHAPTCVQFSWRSVRPKTVPNLLDATSGNYRECCQTSTLAEGRALRRAGPAIHVPLFHQNQGAIARAEADAERLRRQYVEPPRHGGLGSRASAHSALAGNRIWRSGETRSCRKPARL